MIERERERERESVFVRVRVNNCCIVKANLRCGMQAHWSHDQKYQSHDELAGALYYTS